MSTRRDEIDRELRHLRKLASQLTDQRTLDAIENLIANLEAEKTALDKNEAANRGGLFSFGFSVVAFM